MPPTDESIIDALKTMPGSSPNSITTYINNLKRGVKDTAAPSAYALLKNPKKYIPILRENVTKVNSRISVYIAIITAMRASGLKFTKKDEYNAWYTGMMEDKTERRRDETMQIATETHKKGEVEWANVIKVRDNLPKDSPEYLLLSMYTFVPPRRQEDYAKLRVYDDPAILPALDHNHFHMTHPKHGPYFYLHTFKTARSIGTFFNNRYIPTALLDAIKVSFATRPREYMFVQHNDEPFNSTNAFTKYSNGTLKRLFNSPVTVNSLRHSFAKWFNRQPNITVHEHGLVARQMGHTITKNRLYNNYAEQPKMVFLQNP